MDFFFAILVSYSSSYRYLRIIYPLKTHILQSFRATCIICAVTWVLAVTVMAAFISVSFVTQRRPASIPKTCLDLHSTNTGLVHKIFHICTIINFLCVLVFMVYVYYRSSRKVSAVQQSQITSSNTKKLVQSRRNMTVLVSVFCLCFIPYHLVNFPYVFLGCSQSQVLYFLKEFTKVLSAFNVCLDPFIYFIFCKDFREQLKSTFCLQKDNSPALSAEKGTGLEQVSPQ